MTQKSDNSGIRSQKTETYLIEITGIVQGVGFRPFVWLAAEKLMLSGSVANTSGGVVIRVNSDNEEDVLKFGEYIRKNKPAAALIENINYGRISFEEFNGFNIEKSYHVKNTFTLVSPDIATCDKCISDINDLKNSRRFNYPFTNCTNCGPRFTIIEKMPYDRPNTTMKKFIQCPECNAEYADPRDRRFHAQPNACSICGPTLKLISCGGKVIKTADPVTETANLLKKGFIIGIKSLGGFQLACDATNGTAVAELRKRKARPAKPFALMFKDYSSISKLYDLSRIEKESLCSPAAPIVLVRKKAMACGATFSNNTENNSDKFLQSGYDIGRTENSERLQQAELQESVAFKASKPGNGPGIKSSELFHGMHAAASREISLEVSYYDKYDGVMLPYTPLHHLLFKHLAIPLVMTSGNISEEPIAYKNSEALIRLGNICDYLLINDRDIFSRYDDSVIRIFDDKEMIVRRARGYAPYPVKTGVDIGSSVVLAVGAQEKNTFCLYTSNNAIVSQHIGDLDTQESCDFFIQSMKNYKKIFGIKKIDIIVSDKHPDYFSTKFAKDHFRSAKKIQIQHHESHIASVIAENRLLESLNASASGSENPKIFPLAKPECESANTLKSDKKTRTISIADTDSGMSGRKFSNGELILGFAWDGTGFGNDGKIWGSEVLTVDGSFNFNRIGSLGEKCLPGGEITIKKPYRMAFCYLYDIWKADILNNNPSCAIHGIKDAAAIKAPATGSGDAQHAANRDSQSGCSNKEPEAANSHNNSADSHVKDAGFVDYIFRNFQFYKDFSSENEIAIIKSQIETGFNSPVTTSMGRFFDAVSSILDIAHIVSYEGEAAIKLEMMADLHCDLEYDLRYLNMPGFYDNGPFVLDDYHILRQVLTDIKKSVSLSVISAKFHNSLARSILLISQGMQKKYCIKNIALSGGVFQNNYLIAKSFELLKKHGFKPFTNFKVPVNDGGISLGQSYYGAWKINQNDRSR